jgi:hypothetical protein
MDMGMKMKNHNIILSSIFFLSSLMASNSVCASIISGTISNWQESGPTQTIGDGTNHVSLEWSINTYDRGWFYGSDYSGDTDVAYATGITDISQISDASIFSFTSTYTGPHCDADCYASDIGDFLIWRNINTGYYGVLRIDDIVVTNMMTPIADLNGTWWFQTDGTANFSAVPLPAAVWLLGSGLFGLIGFSKRKKTTIVAQRGYS